MLKKVSYCIFLIIVIVTSGKTFLHVWGNVKTLFMANHLSFRSFMWNFLDNNGLFCILFIISLGITAYYLRYGKKAEALAAQLLPVLSMPLANIGFLIILIS